MAAAKQALYYAEKKSKVVILYGRKWGQEYCNAKQNGINKCKIFNGYPFGNILAGVHSNMNIEDIVYNNRNK